jgi:hypothetical protein
MNPVDANLPKTKLLAAIAMGRFFIFAIPGLSFALAVVELKTRKPGDS